MKVHFDQHLIRRLERAFSHMRAQLAIVIQSHGHLLACFLCFAKIFTSYFYNLCIIKDPLKQLNISNVALDSRVSDAFSNVEILCK